MPSSTAGQTDKIIRHGNFIITLHANGTFSVSTR